VILVGAALRRTLCSAVVFSSYLICGAAAHAQVPLEILHSFDARPDLGVTSNSIMQADAGVFYLTSARGGAYLKGTVFKMTTGGSVTMLHEFSGGADGHTGRPARRSERRQLLRDNRERRVGRPRHDLPHDAGRGAYHSSLIHWRNGRRRLSQSGPHSGD
jgi:uncharacterized repeat protein (TIGR03803 family)